MIGVLLVDEHRRIIHPKIDLWYFLQYVAPDCAHLYSPTAEQSSCVQGICAVSSSDSGTRSGDHSLSFQVCTSSSAFDLERVSPSHAALHFAVHGRRFHPECHILSVDSRGSC